MTARFGDRATFAIEIGDFWSPPAVRHVDVWAGGKHLTADDNAAFVSTLCLHMRDTIARVRDRAVLPSPFPGRVPQEIFRLLKADAAELAEPYWFRSWDEILDNVAPMYVYLDGDLVIVFAFCQDNHPTPEDLGKVFVARIDPDDFVGIAEAAVAALESTTSE